MSNQYAHPEVLVSTDWVNANLTDPKIKLLEIDFNTFHYDAGHLPGAIGFNWQTQLQDQLTRNILTKEQFETLVGNAGISADDTVIIYGDSNNWFAAYGFWLFKMYGHADLRLMDGGRQKWVNEEDKPVVKEKPKHTPVKYIAKEPDTSMRAFLLEVLDATKNETCTIIDVRTTPEYTGRMITAPGSSEPTLRGGHIPGAKGIPWGAAVNITDGTFKTADELKKIYIGEKGVDPNKPAIVYCRIGERSSHTWFVLKYLLGLENVKNYDGSWAEYGNVIGAPIEKHA